MSGNMAPTPDLEFEFGDRLYSIRMAPTDGPDIGYAMIFPSMTIAKVIDVRAVSPLLSTGAGG
jgi:putative transport protein